MVPKRPGQFLNPFRKMTLAEHPPDPTHQVSNVWPQALFTGTITPELALLPVAPQPWAAPPLAVEVGGPCETTLQPKSPQHLTDLHSLEDKNVCRLCREAPGQAF